MDKEGPRDGRRGLKELGLGGEEIGYRVLRYGPGLLHTSDWILTTVKLSSLNPHPLIPFLL